MKSSILRKVVILFGIICVTGFFRATLSESKEFPTKPITLVNCYGAGGGADVSMRALVSVFHDYFGQPGIVLLKPGGGGIVAGDFLVKSAADGYTIANLSANAAVPEVYTHFKKATYSSKDLRPVALFNNWPCGLHVKADSPFKTFRELVEFARQNPGKMSYSHVGRGDSFHILMELVKAQEGLIIQDVPFASGTESAMQVLGGHVDCGLSAVAGTVDSLITSGKLRLLAVHHRERLPISPDTPTFEELGYKFRPHYQAFFVPKDTPDEIVEKLRAGLQKAYQDKSFKTMMDKMGFIIGGELEDLENYIKMETDIVRPLLESLGLGPK